MFGSFRGPTSAQQPLQQPSIGIRCACVNSYTTYDKIWTNTPKAGGICLLLSSQAYEVSYADQNTNSLYTQYLLEGLHGVKFQVDDNGRNILYSGSVDDNGCITPQLLHEYVYHKVASVERQIPKIKLSSVLDRCVAMGRN